MTNIMSDIENNVNPSPRFTGIFIPVEILEMEGLSPFMQILLSWIDALYSDEHGGCFASNAYLAARMKVEENTLSKALTELRRKGLVETVSFDGRTRVMRALIHLKVHERQSKSGLDKNPIAIGKKSNPRLEKNPYPSYIENKEENKDYIFACAKKKKKVLPVPKKEDDPKVEYGSHVRLSAKQYAKLLELYGEKYLAELIDRVNDYCAATKPKGYSDYAAAIRNFVRNEKSKGNSHVPGIQTVKERIHQRQLDENKQLYGGFNNAKNHLKY